MNYDETVDWLFQQFPAWHVQGASAYKPGLDNVIELSAAFGNPEKQLKFVHIAGTNGKGSVSNMLASVLTEADYKTGLFTSPHIHEFTERIRVNGKEAEKQYIVDFCEKLRNTGFTVKPSFFEITWIMALCYFRDSHCDIVVAETGLGGRLDATNIILPEVCAITNIGLDHTNILGDTRAQIAFEKAGIVKRGVPLVVGQTDEEIAPVIENKCSEMSARLTVAKPLLFYPHGIAGYQHENFDTAYAVIEELRKAGWQIGEEAMMRGIVHLRRNTGFYGRMEIVAEKPLTIVDCAHNADGIGKLLKSLGRKGDLHIVYGTSADKDLQAIRLLLPADAHYYFTAFSSPRSASLAQLQQNFGGAGRSANFFEDPLKALGAARSTANENDTILVFGSFFLISDFFEEFFT
jgi:dihydrofolate synthase / folylpolyglutamate synthase